MGSDTYDLLNEQSIELRPPSDLHPSDLQNGSVSHKRLALGSSLSVCRLVHSPHLHNSLEYT